MTRKAPDPNLATKAATRANKRRAKQYLKDLEEIRQEARAQGSLSLAGELTYKLYEHAVGKPKERKEVEVLHSISVTVEVIPPVAEDLRIVGGRERAALPPAESDATAPSVQAVRDSLERCYGDE